MERARIASTFTASPDEAVKPPAAAFMAGRKWEEIERVPGAEHSGLVGDIEDRPRRPTR